MTAHAKVFGASGFERLMLCPGSAVLTAGAPRRASQYSAEGTVIHDVAANVLKGMFWPLPGSSHEADGFTFTWDADMRACAETYVDYVRGLDGDFTLVEERVRFGPVIGIDDLDDGFGTADAIAGKGDELIVIDLKCGRGVEVHAYVSEGNDLSPNPQLALYAIGALADMQGIAGDFTSVRLVIVQPRAGGISEYVLTVDELEAWAENVPSKTVDAVLAAALEDDANLPKHLNPTEKGCKFCAAKATCPALRDEVAAAVTGGTHTPATPDEFANLMAFASDPRESQAFDAASDASEAQWISAALSQVDLIEDWCKAVRAEAERRLVAGEPVPGYKLVQGKRGARAWADEAMAEDVLRKQMRLPVEKAYNLKLITPPQAEKLHKAGDIGPRQWPKLQQLITQGEGRPHVAPESDPRPAITINVVAEDFGLA